MDEQIWTAWQQDWQWVLSSMTRKAVEVDELQMPEVEDLEIAPPVPLERVREREQGIILPTEFVEVLTRFSSGVKLHWEFWLETGNAPPQPFEQLLGSGGDWGYLWNFESLPLFNDNLQGWLTTRTTEEEGPAGLAWRNKTAFNCEPTGKLCAFDVSQGNSNCPVFFLDHEHGSRHGMRLGLNFVDFITRWSNLGCPFPGSLYEFYDSSENLLMDSGEFVENCKRWVSQ